MYQHSNSTETRNQFLDKLYLARKENPRGHAWGWSTNCEVRALGDEPAACLIQRKRYLLMETESSEWWARSTMGNFNFAWIFFFQFQIAFWGFYKMTDCKPLFLLLVRHWLFALSLPLRRKDLINCGWKHSMWWCWYSIMLQWYRSSFTGRFPCPFTRFLLTCGYKWQHLSQHLRKSAKVISFCVSGCNSLNGQIGKHTWLRWTGMAALYHSIREAILTNKAIY